MSESSPPEPSRYVPQNPEYECHDIIEMAQSLFPDEDEDEEEDEDEMPEPSKTSVLSVRKSIPKVVAFGSRFDPSKKFQPQPKVARNDLVFPSSMIDSQFCDTTYKTISGELEKSNKRGSLGYRAPRFKTKKLEDTGRCYTVEEPKPIKPCFVPFNSLPVKPPKVTIRQQTVLNAEVPSCRSLARLHCFGGYAPVLPGVDIVSGTAGPPTCMICGKVIIKQDYYHRELRDFVCLHCVREGKYRLLEKFKLPEFNYFRPARDFQYIFDDPAKRDITILKRKVAKTAYMAWYTPKPCVDP